MTTRNFVLRILINAVAIAVTAALLEGIHVTNDLGPLILVGLVLTLVNSFLKPILIFLSCPAVLLTLGLFILVVNAVVLMVASSLVGENLVIDGFWWAFFGGIIMSVVNLVLEGVFGLDDDQPAAPRKRPN